MPRCLAPSNRTPAANQPATGRAGLRPRLEPLEPRIVLSTLASLSPEGGQMILPDDSPLKESAAVVRHGTWYFDRDNAGGAAESAVTFGNPTDVPLVGYFNADTDADLAVFRSGLWFFDLDNQGGAAERSLLFGLPGDKPLTGLWTGTGFDDDSLELVQADDPAAARLVRPIEQAAVVRDGNHWYFDLDGQGGTAEKNFLFGLPGDIPLAGDFNADGITDAAVFRAGVWYFDLDGQGGMAEASTTFGLRGDKPVVGDWDGDGTDELAVVRQGIWYFDLDGNGADAEKHFAFGRPGDVPTAGHWHDLLDEPPTAGAPQPEASIGQTDATVQVRQAEVAEPALAQSGSTCDGIAADGVSIAWESNVVDDLFGGLL